MHKFQKHERYGTKAVHNLNPTAQPTGSISPSLSPALYLENILTMMC